ncbi:MAG: GtrA family protein [Alphaproteobacteria bacterium]|nr:GtrA family protein [Alphaproteobacteria bacterium]
MTKIWFLIDEKLRFLTLATLVMSGRFLIFSGLGVLFSPKHYQIILAITWLVSSYLAFLLYKHLVFISKGNHWKQYMKSLLIWCVSYVINVFLLNLLVEGLFFSPFVAQGLIILFLLITNYLLFKYFAFK